MNSIPHNLTEEQCYEQIISLLNEKGALYYVFERKLCRKIERLEKEVLADLLRVLNEAEERLKYKANEVERAAFYRSVSSGEGEWFFGYKGEGETMVGEYADHALTLLQKKDQK